MGVTTPDWVKHAVFYQIFPDRFCRSSRVQHPPAIRFQPWGTPPTARGFQGGDLLGIVDRLDYLAELGVNALYLNPIFSSASNHRYHTYDYMQVDPLLGGEAAFRELLDEAHARAMRVVIDGVFNHTGRGFWAFHHLLETGNSSPYLDWFRVRDWPLRPYQFSEEKPHLVAQLARPHFAIAYPKHLMQPEIDSGNITVSPRDVGVVGIGPFMLDNVQKGSVVQVRRFDSYFETDDHGQRLPYLDGIDFFITMNPDAMDAAFLSGRVDGGARGPGFNLSKERAEVYEGDLGDDVQFVRVGFYGWGFDFNTVHESPVQDVRVRRAMALWINKQDAIDAVLGGFGEKFTLLDSGNPYTNPDFETWLIYDDSRREEARAEAKRLLAEAGYADGLTLKENCWTVAQQSCEYIQAQLAELGITMDFKIVDTPGYSATSVTLDNDTNSASGWPSGNAIPEMIRQDLAPYSTNPGATFQHEDPRIEEYFGQLEAAGTLDERIRIFREMEEYIIREQVYRVSLYGETAVTPYRSYVKGYQPPAGNVNVNYDHATTWLDK